MTIPIIDSLLICYIFDRTRNLESSALYVNISPNVKPSDSLITLLESFRLWSFLKNGSLKIRDISGKLFLYLSNYNPIIFRNIFSDNRRIYIFFSFIDNVTVNIQQRNYASDLNTLQTFYVCNRIIRSN